MPFPTITETRGASICFGPSNGAAFGALLVPDAFLPAVDAPAVADPGWFTGVDVPAPFLHTAADTFLSAPAVTPEEVPGAVSHSDH
jgi:hypothetical protein